MKLFRNLVQLKRMKMKLNKNKNLTKKKRMTFAAIGKSYKQMYIRFGKLKS